MKIKCDNEACQYEWEARVPSPVECPRCKRRLGTWKTSRPRKPKEDGNDDST